jgi:hypothetical protein
MLSLRSAEDDDEPRNSKHVTLIVAFVGPIELL